MDYLFGLIKENIKVFEKKIVCIEKKFIHGKTVENIKENIEWTKNKEKEFINSQMKEFFMDNGLKVNYMGRKIIYQNCAIKVDVWKEGKLIN